jgi:hypothetical protein
MCEKRCGGVWCDKIDECVKNTSRGTLKIFKKEIKMKIALKQSAAIQLDQEDISALSTILDLAELRLKEGERNRDYSFEDVKAAERFMYFVREKLQLRRF